MENIKILLIEPNPAIGDLIAKNLQRTFNAEVIFFSNTAVGLEKIKAGEKFSLLLLRNQTEETQDTAVEPIAAHFLNLIYDLSLKIPIIIIGEVEHVLKKYALVTEKLRIEEINRLILKALNLKKEDFEHLKLPEYVGFPVKHFYLMTISPCDIYIKLVKKTGDEYIKRLNMGENFTKEDLIKYEELGLTEFFIERSEYEDFMNGLFVQTINSLKVKRSLEENIEALGDSYVISTDIMRELGITPGCLAMVDQTLQMMKNQIVKADKLGQLLRKLLDNKMSFSYRRSYLVSTLAYTLLPKMEWGSGDQQNQLLEKICMVSYFHDLYLEEERHLKVCDTEALKKGSFTAREVDLILNHANRAALLVQTYPKLPQGIDIIIKQHHGVSNGVGFPEALTAAISPMAIFFMVVEDFANSILAINEPSENLAAAMREALKPLKAKYQLPSYRKIVTEIEYLMTPRK